MPAYHPSLNDQQVADLLTFIRSAWNNKAPAVTTAQVSRLRQLTVQAAPDSGTTTLSLQNGSKP
jgi:hypothetical protein